jgi:hypothetical protein
LQRHCTIAGSSIIESTRPRGYAVAQLVALRYKPEGRGFDSRLGH